MFRFRFGPGRTGRQVEPVHVVLDEPVVEHAVQHQSIKRKTTVCPPTQEDDDDFVDPPRPNDSVQHESKKRRTTVCPPTQEDDDDDDDFVDPPLKHIRKQKVLSLFYCRCDSSNTKFCYYNNYNLSQPRHFCKNCRRYWTKGGTLRNIPIGGATRKINKRSSNPTKRTSPVMQQPPPPPPPPPPAAPPLPLKEEPCVGYGYGNNQHMEANIGNLSSLLGANPMGPFGNLLIDGLSSNLASKSDDDVLIRTPIVV
ncbi:hypothetical protein LXL04_025701 [Taraxacum kok-saghyz]